MASKTIKANAPKGATHYAQYQHASLLIVYYRLAEGRCFMFFRGDWIESPKPDLKKL